MEMHTKENERMMKTLQLEVRKEAAVSCHAFPGFALSLALLPCILPWRALHWRVKNMLSFRGL